MKRFGVSFFVVSCFVACLFATTAFAQWPASGPGPKRVEGVRQKQPRVVLAPSPYSAGHVFGGTASGIIKQYTGTGTFLDALDNGLAGYTTGMVFDKNGNLYGTTFNGGQVTKFSGPALPHTLSMFATTDPGGDCESMARDTLGNLYVGQADGTRDILKLDPTTGAIVDRFDVPTGPRGTDWIELAGDQRTMYYTSEGNRIFRYDIVSRTALPDFNPSPLPGANAYALRILPGGGVIVADWENLVRLNAAGSVIQTYDAPGEDSWFAMNLDADGTSFWSGGLSSNNFYKFNIATGAVLLGPIATGGPTLAGLTVFGEITVGQCANNIPPSFVSPTPQCGSTINATVGSPVSFTMKASDANSNQGVTLSVSGLPVGATMTPALPTSGNPVQSVFNWTPTGSSSSTVTFKAKDECGDSAVCAITINVTGGPPIDPNPPSCNITATIPGPPQQIQVTVRDLESGLASVVVQTATNATVVVPPFTVGTTAPVVITATKINQSLSSTVILRVGDVAQNFTVCDPVYTTLSAEVPQDFALGANYPNPFNPTTRIDFNISKPEGSVSLKVFDVLGREVKTLLSEPMQPGQYFIEWDGTNNQGIAVTSGVYIYRMVAGEFVATRRMTLMR